MTEQETLVQLCRAQQARNNSPGGGNAESQLDEIFQLAETKPALAVTTAIMMQERMQVPYWIDKVIVPRVDVVLGADTDILRRATAYMAGNALAKETIGVPADPQMIQAIAQCLTALNRTPRQAQEVRELADHFYEQCRQANVNYGGDFAERYAPIDFFTTKKQTEIWNHIYMEGLALD